MNKMIMYACCHILTSTSYFSGLIADEAAAVPSISSKESILNIDPTLCTKEVLMTFFPQPVVKAVLVQHQVSEEEANQIAKELSQKDQEVVKTVETKASKMEPNPLNDLNQRDTAVKIFRETLYEVFAKVLKAHDVKADDNQIQTILDDMQEAKGKLFVECIKRDRVSSRSPDPKSS